MDFFNGIFLNKHRKGNGRPWILMGRKTLLDLDYADDLSILDESVRILNIGSYNNGFPILEYWKLQ